MISPTRAEMPNAPTDRESELVGEYFLYLKDLFEKGLVSFVGRTL